MNILTVLRDKCDVDVFFDFAKAFDAFSRQLLLLKLSAYGFSEYTLS